MNKNTILLTIAVIGVLLTGVLIFTNKNLNQFSFFKSGFGLSNDAIAKKSLDYLNTTVLAGQSQATLVSVSEESGLVKMKIKIGSNDYDSYATRDGKLLFPQAFAMESAVAHQPNENNQASSAQTCDSLKKTDKPLVEAYVVSKCPFGLQMQRIMADVVKSAPFLSQFMKVRYMGSISNGAITAMHGDAEARENLRQICIRDEQNTKYWDYISCHIKAGDTAGCEKTAGIDAAKLSGCISDKNRGLVYAKEDFDLANKYNVSGSPTLISNGDAVSEFSFGGRTPDALKSIVCCSSSSQPEVCSTKLSTTEAATSFSAAYSSGGSSGSENSGANGASCAPVQ